MAEQSLPPYRTEGVIVNPIAGALLADSGALSAGVHEFEIVVGSTVAARVNFEWRKADSTVKHRQPIFLLASSSFAHRHGEGFSIVCEAADRFVVVADAIVAGSVSATLTVA